MNIKNSNDKYSVISISMHWLMLILFIAVYACIELREFYPKKSDPREALKMWHFMLGLSIFALVWLRLFFRLKQPTPAITPTPPAWQNYSAKVVHLFLYLMMFCMPIAGWLILSGEGKVIPFFGLELPALIPKNKELAHSIEEIHETVGTIGYYVIAIHAIAALFHHYIKHDNTLTRMLFNKTNNK